MAYFISLKYLRSLKEFRKNLHVKIPPKSPCVNFQSLGIFKILIFYSKRNFLRISAHPAQPRPCRPATPRRSSAPRSAHLAQAALAYLPKGVFSSTLRTSAETHSLSHVTAMWGLPVSSIPFPMPADRCRFSSLPPATPRRYSPRHHFPLNPPLNLTPIFNGVKAINATVTPPGHPSLVLPRPL
jgi:hypothetical protein